MAKVGRKQFDGKDPEIVLKKLQECWLYGISDKIACKYAGITQQTLINFLIKNPKVKTQREELKSNPAFKAHKAWIDSFKENPELAMKYLERRFPDDWAPTQKVKGKIEHKNVHEIIVEMLTTDKTPQIEDKVQEAEVVENAETPNSTI